ncbi:MAG: dipeptidase [Candidatus Saccharicenans sp.]
MKRSIKLIFALISIIFFITILSEAANKTDNHRRPVDPFNCFTVLVGREASADGSVMVAHNEDDYGNIIVNVRKIAPRNYGPKIKINLGNGAVYETDGRTNGFLWIEATSQEFADSFINEHGVLITSDSCPSRETKEDFTEGGIGYMLRRLVAEKAKSAREAVQLIGQLVEQYGYRSSGRTYSVADKNEAWMVAVIKGRHWFAQRVPDDQVAVIPNFYTIGQIRLDDPDNFMGSPDIIDYARKNGWYDETRDGAFIFKKVFNRPSNREPVFDGNTLRMWRGVSRLSGQNWEITADFPFSFKPVKKVTPEMLMSLLRDHYEGTPYDATAGYQQGSPNKTKFRTICTSSTINSFVACLNNRKPEPISILVWLAFGKPDTTVYLPIYYGVEALPEGAGYGPATHDYDLFYKQHFEPTELTSVKDRLLSTKVRLFENLVEANYGQMIKVVKKDLSPVEKKYLTGQANFENKFRELYARNKIAAQKLLNDYLATAFTQVENIYHRLLKSSQPS